MTATADKQPAAAEQFDDGRRSFTDAAGRTWSLRVSVGTLPRLRDQMAVDVAAVVEQPLDIFVKLTTEDEFLAGVLWAIVEPEAVARGVTAEEFADAILGPQLYDAGRVVCNAIVDFFRDPRARDAVREVFQKAWQVGTRTSQLAMARTTKAIGDVDVERTAQTLLSSFGNAPESSASTRRRSRSAN